MQHSISFVEAKHKLEAFCAYQDRCIHEVKNKIYSFGLSLEDQEKLILYLIETKFLDEERFVHSYVSGKFRYKNWGKIKIRQHLKLKRVEEVLIKKGLAQIDADLYYETIKSLLSRKDIALNHSNLSLYERKNKLVRYLLSKGFEMDLVLDALDEIVKQS